MSKILPILIGFKSRQLRRRLIYHRIINTEEEADIWLANIAVNYLKIYPTDDVIEKIEEKAFMGYDFYTRHDIEELERLQHNKKSIRLILIDCKFNLKEYLNKCKLNWIPGKIIESHIEPASTIIESLFRWGVTVPSPDILGIWESLYKYFLNNKIEEDLVFVVTNTIASRLLPSSYMLDNHENIWFHKYHYWLATNNLAKYVMLLFSFYGQYKFWTNQRSFPNYIDYYRQPHNIFLDPEIQLREHLLHYSDFINTNIHPLNFHIEKKVKIVCDDKLKLSNELEKIGFIVEEVSYEKYKYTPDPTIWCGKYYQAIRMLGKNINIYIDIDKSGRRNKIFKLTIAKYYERLDLPKDIDIVVLSPGIYNEAANRAKIVVAYDQECANRAQLAGALVVSNDIKNTIPISSKLLLQVRHLLDHYSDHLGMIEEGQRSMMIYTPESIAQQIKYFI